MLRLPFCELRAGGPSFLPAPLRCPAGRELLRHLSRALLQKREEVAGGRRDAAQGEGGHDFQELPPLRFTGRRTWEAAGLKAGAFYPHTEALGAENQRLTLGPSFTPLREALSPDLELTFCHLLRLMPRFSISLENRVRVERGELGPSLCLNTSPSSHTKKWPCLSTGACHPLLAETLRDQRRASRPARLTCRETRCG